MKLASTWTLIISQFCFLAIHCSPSIVPRVSRGQKAKASHWPSQVVITNEESGLVCGGSVISRDWVLTAAHCASPKRSEVGNLMKHVITIGAQNRRIREPQQVIRGVKKVEVFPKYETQNHSFDFALLQMNEPIDFIRHANVKPMCLDLCGLDMSKRKCVLTGFGSLDNYSDFPDELQQLEMKPFDHRKCQKIHEEEYTGSSKERVTDLQFCMVSTKKPAKRRDNSNGGGCPGDSGGPIQCQVGNKFYQTGVAWSSTHCETEPTVFQIIAKYAKFIEEKTGYKLPAYCPRNSACE